MGRSDQSNTSGTEFEVLLLPPIDLVARRPPAGRQALHETSPGHGDPAKKPRRHAFQRLGEFPDSLSLFRPAHGSR
jgi:hypothetical protein